MSDEGREQRHEGRALSALSTRSKDARQRADTNKRKVEVVRRAADTARTRADSHAPDVENGKVVETGTVGYVEWFNLYRGFGFVKRDCDDVDDKSASLFVHRSMIAKPNTDHLLPSLRRGERVMFDVIEYGKGDAATNVTNADGGEVKGLLYAPMAHALPPAWAVHLVPASRQPIRHYGKVRETRRENDTKRVHYVDKWTDADIVERGVHGRVNWFNTKKGFGFVRRTDDDDDAYFVHRTSILAPNDAHIIESLDADESVRFDVCRCRDKANGDDARVEAVNVTGPDGAPVLGDAHVPRVGEIDVPLWILEVLTRGRVHDEIERGQYDSPARRRPAHGRQYELKTGTSSVSPRGSRLVQSRRASERQSPRETGKDSKTATSKSRE